jgi:hypothetical protein
VAAPIVKWDEATVYKPSQQTTPAWDSAFRYASLTGGAACYITFKSGQTNARWIAGLSYNSSTTSFTIAALSFGIQFNETGTIEIMESGVSRGVYGDPYKLTDTFSVLFDSKQVTYTQNGRTLYTSTVTLTGAPMRGEGILYSPGTIVKNLFFGPLPACVRV